jgi:acylpyruvate hydrolase
MRFVTVKSGDGTAAGVMANGEVAVIRDTSTGRPAYPDVGALLRAGEEGELLASAALSAGASEPVGERRLLRPVLAPGATVCVGLNYRNHIQEMGRELPSHPTFFSKLARALTDPFADVPLPEVSQKVDYEGELAVVIGRGGRSIPPERAWDAVAGLTVMNDVTMRDLQHRTTQWFSGKSFEASTPVGPALVTADELGSIGELTLRVGVDGEERQAASIDDLVFGVPQLVSELSGMFTLEPGDLIATGTPGGVGHAADPPRHLGEGSVVEVEIAGIGTLRNRFTRDPHAA